MRIGGYRIWLVLLTLILGLALLFGTQHLYETQRVDRPLAELFTSRDDVKDFAIRAEGRDLEIVVSVAPVENLRESYLELEGEARQVLGEEPFRLKIEDGRNEDLEEDYYRLHFAFQEALATGRFTSLPATLDKAREEWGLDVARAYVDERFLYVQLEKDDAYLYEILPRGENGAGGGAQGGGESS